MKLYSCRVNVMGDVVQHTVPKERITEKELMLLRRIHGNEAIHGLRELGESPVDEMEELHRLAMVYGRERVEEAFRLSLDDYDQWLALKLSEGDDERKAAKTMAKIRLGELYQASAADSGEDEPEEPEEVPMPVVSQASKSKVVQESLD